MGASLPLPEALVDRAARVLEERLGLDLLPARRDGVARALAAAVAEPGGERLRQSLECLPASALSRQQLDVLASHLTVGETYFFRDPEVFALLEGRLLPELIRGRGGRERHLRLWSAGCATGEEAYSLAIAAARLLPDPGDWQVSVLGTDVNPRFLARAAQGSYGEWSFRAVDAALRNRCFHLEADGRRQVAPRLRRLVRFAPLNLAEDAYPAMEPATFAMDVILCRHVLMYLRRDLIATVVDRLARCLVDGGVLLVGPVECPWIVHPELRAEGTGALTLFRKVARTAALPSSLPPPEPASPAAAERAADLAARARACANDGRLEEALAWIGRAVAADKLDPAWTYLQALILLELGRGGPAAAALRRTLYLDPGPPLAALAHFALGNLMARQGRRGEAERHYRQVRALVGREPAGTVLAEAPALTAGRLAEIVDGLLAAEAP